MNLTSFILIVIILIIAIILSTYYLVKNWKMPPPNCHCCGRETEKEWICERCNQHYCDNCSAPFTYMNQIDFPCCEDCADNSWDKDFD